MSLKEADKLGVVREILSKRIKQKEGAANLGITVRQMRRIRKRTFLLGADREQLHFEKNTRHAFVGETLMVARIISADFAKLLEQGSTALTLRVNRLSVSHQFEKSACRKYTPFLRAPMPAPQSTYHSLESDSLWLSVINTLGCKNMRCRK